MTHDGSTAVGCGAASEGQAHGSGRSIAVALLPLMAVVFVAYVVTGVAVSAAVVAGTAMFSARHFGSMSLLRATPSRARA